MKDLIVAIVSYDDNILLRRGEGKDYWHMPTDIVSPTETNGIALHRTVRSQAGIFVTDLVDFSQECTQSVNISYYTCTATSKSVGPGRGVAEARWFAKEDVKNHCHEKAIDLWSLQVKYFFGV